MKYKVSKQYLRGNETQFASFNDLADAKLFIQARIEADVTLNVKVTYRIIELGEAIAEFQSDETGDAQSGSGQSKGSSSTFSPTPLNTAPRPPGTPQRWLKDNDDLKDKDK